MASRRNEGRFHPRGARSPGLEPHARHSSRMHGTRMVIAGMVRTLPAYQQVMERVSGDFDLVVLSSLALSAPSLAEADKIPRITLHMQPALFRSIYECPVFMEELTWLTRAPRWTKRLFFAMVDAFLELRPQPAKQLSPWHRSPAAAELL